MPEQSDLSDPLLTPNEAAELLEVDDSTVRRWINAGYLAAVRLPGLRPRWRIKRSAVAALQQAEAVTPAG